ncbi:hypothetical protein RvY_11415 [Ramazzottius varieornatus]|uniref:Metalloendopeptidase n=1 Tax=Ramazzottius varieornatus TaxID=947166 RepID=A0A1D1VPW1_RAMVA|nr:hypothetical protein RvY_11415 [Ramazzottius varieornatus]
MNDLCGTWNFERRYSRASLMSFFFIYMSTFAGAYLYEGDIWIDGMDERTDFAFTDMQLNNAIFDRRLRWKNGLVPYQLGLAFASGEEKQIIEEALRDLMAKTCVRFVPRIAEPHFIRFARESPEGCYSDIARRRKNDGRGQLINLGIGCETFGTVQHEILHEIGFFHEQSRNDRDEYVTIVWDNVVNGTKNKNFNAERTDNLNMPYDYASIMHYEENAFAIDSMKPTIVPRIRGVKLGNREGLSLLDVEKINRLYECSSPTIPRGSNEGIRWTDENYAHGCDFPGNDLSTVKIPGRNCGRTCESTHGCTHFTWSKSEGGTCRLKQGGKRKEDAVKVADSSVVCGVVKPLMKRTIDWNKENWAFGCDFPGNSLTSVEVAGAQCGPTCLRQEGCTHFHWIGGNCYLKQGEKRKEDAVRVYDNAVVCGVVVPQAERAIEWKEDDWAYGCEFPGDDLSIVKVSGPDCGPACLTTPDCTHFTWSSADGGTCRLKQGGKRKEDAVRVADDAVVCGVVPPLSERAIEWYDNWANGCDFLGNDMSTVTVSAAQCGPACAQSQGCTHFHWQRGTCWMKRGGKSKNDAVKIHDNSAVCGVVS